MKRILFVATPQNMQVYRNVYDANGNIVPQAPYTGGVRAEYSVQQGTRPAQVIMTYP